MKKYPIITEAKNSPLTDHNTGYVIERDDDIDWFWISDEEVDLIKNL